MQKGLEVADYFAESDLLGRVGIQALVCTVFFSEFTAGVYHPWLVHCLAKGGGLDVYPLLCIY